jgi:CRISPR/Cas system-associated endonuclease/helicase Cas3
MGKKSKKCESGNSSSKLSAAAITATAVIAILAGEANITLTDKNAVLKDLRPDARVKTEQVHRYTRWGINAEGNRVLVVLNTSGTAIKSYEDYAQKYPAMKTLSV